MDLHEEIEKKRAERYAETTAGLGRYHEDSALWLVVLDAHMVCDAAFLAALLSAVHCFLVLNAENAVAVLLGDEFLIATDPSSMQNSMQSIAKIKKELEVAVAAATEQSQRPKLHCAFSLALCYANRLQRSHRYLHPRILCCCGDGTGNAEADRNHISLMNCIFSCQKLEMPIDAYVLGQADSVFLQQASHITGGAYYRRTHVAGSSQAHLQVLTSVFLADRFSRSHLLLPHAGDVDFRATCFCHRRPVEVGFVCSVCLSVFCSHVGRCSTCGTEMRVDGAPVDM